MSNRDLIIKKISVYNTDKNRETFIPNIKFWGLKYKSKFIFYCLDQVHKNSVIYLQH